MFATPKKPSPQPPNHAAALQKLLALPPAADLLVAATLGIYGLVAIYVEGERFIGVVCIIIALAFALLGVAATQRDMKAYKIIAAAPTPQDLRALSAQQFEAYLVALFGLAGYQVRSGADELHRQDDADLIAVRRKETALIQFNHFDEEYVSLRAVQSLHKAASLMRATDAVAITLGAFAPDAAAWAARKGVRLMTERDVLEMAAEFIGEQPAPEQNTPTTNEQTEPLEPQSTLPRKPSASSRILFVDCAGIFNGPSQLPALLADHPTYNVVAATLPPGQSLDTLRSQLGVYGNRIIGVLPSTSQSRYFAIQDYLRTTLHGQRVQWFAIDSKVREYPEGCTELIAVNPAFGFDAGVARRILDAVHLAERRALAMG